MKDENSGGLHRFRNFSGGVTTEEKLGRRPGFGPSHATVEES